MQIDLGTTLHMRGRDYICSAISTSCTRRYAPCDSEQYDREYVHIPGVSNTVVVKSEIDQFAAGEPIEVEIENVELTSPGVDWMQIHNKYNVRVIRPRKDEAEDAGVHEQQSSSGGGATDSTTEASTDETTGDGRSGDQGGSGDGQPVVGQNGEAVHQDG